MGFEHGCRGQHSRVRDACSINVDAQAGESTGACAGSCMGDGRLMYCQTQLCVLHTGQPLSCMISAQLPSVACPALDSAASSQQPEDRELAHQRDPLSPPVAITPSSFTAIAFTMDF